MKEWLAGGGAALAGVGFSLRYTWWRPRLSGIPVLMYHLVKDDVTGTRWPKLRVSVKSFAGQLDAIQSSGRRTLTLSQAAANPRMENGVVITFDDGYRNFYTDVLPLLAQRGMTATMFVVSGLLDGRNQWDIKKNEPVEQLLTRGQVRELEARGIEIGGHSHTHQDLTRLDDRALLRETTGCQKHLTDLLGHPVRTFSYPFGLYDARVARAVERAGFTLSCTTEPGMLSSESHPLTIPRIIVKRSDDALDFRIKLTRAKSTL